MIGVHVPNEYREQIVIPREARNLLSLNEAIIPTTIRSLRATILRRRWR
jgi:hypothetical protein